MKNSVLLAKAYMTSSSTGRRSLRGTTSLIAMAREPLQVLYQTRRARHIVVGIKVFVVEFPMLPMFF
jgi:hypothetical protein